MNDFQEKIMERAYALYLERGSKPGHAMEDWIRAEKEVGEKYGFQGGADSEKHAQPASQTVVKSSKLPSMEVESKGIKKNAKPQEALLFSSGKNTVRSNFKRT